MSVVEIDTGFSFSGYLGFSITYKTASIEEIETLVDSASERTTMVLICHICEIPLGKSN